MVPTGYAASAQTTWMRGQRPDDREEHHGDGPDGPNWVRGQRPDNRVELHGDGPNDHNWLRGQRPGGA